MIKGYAVEDGHLVPMPAPLEALGDGWSGSTSSTRPTPRRARSRRRSASTVPTPDEMQEIEDSSRLYLENGAIYMTANLPSKVESEAAGAGAGHLHPRRERLITAALSRAAVVQDLRVAGRAGRSRLQRRARPC